MGTIVRDLARARSAVDVPTLTLLGKDWAPLVVAVFTSHFSRETSRVAADRFHVQVEATRDTRRVEDARREDARRHRTYDQDVMELIAQDYCRDFVKDALKSPSTGADNRMVGHAA